MPFRMAPVRPPPYPDPMFRQPKNPGSLLLIKSGWAYNLPKHQHVLSSHQKYSPLYIGVFVLRKYSLDCVLQY